MLSSEPGFLASCVFLPTMFLTRNSIFDPKNLPDENLITEAMYSHKKLHCQQISIVFGEKLF